MTTTQNASAPTFRYSAVTFDCSDPAALARFWGEALDLPVAFNTDDFYLLGGKDGAPGLGFCRLPDYRPPTWPGTDQEKQAHIDVGVEDLDAGRPACSPWAPRSPTSSRPRTAGGCCWTRRGIRSACLRWREPGSATRSRRRPRPRTR